MTGSVCGLAPPVIKVALLSPAAVSVSVCVVSPCCWGFVTAWLFCEAPLHLENRLGWCCFIWDHLGLETYCDELLLGGSSSAITILVTFTNEWGHNGEGERDACAYMYTYTCNLAV